MKKFSYLILLALFGAFFLVSCSDNDKEEPQRDKVDFSKLVGVWKTLNGNDTIEFMYNNTLIQVAPGFKKTGTWTTTSDKKLTIDFLGCSFHSSSPHSNYLKHTASTTTIFCTVSFTDNDLLY